jgi:hypothetical protein
VGFRGRGMRRGAHVDLVLPCSRGMEAPCSTRKIVSNRGRKIGVVAEGYKVVSCTPYTPKIRDTRFCDGVVDSAGDFGKQRRGKRDGRRVVVWLMEDCFLAQQQL